MHRCGIRRWQMLPRTGRRNVGQCIGQSRAVVTTPAFNTLARTFGGFSQRVSRIWRRLCKICLMNTHTLISIRTAASGANSVATTCRSRGRTHALSAAGWLCATRCIMRTFNGVILSSATMDQPTNIRIRRRTCLEFSAQAVLANASRMVFAVGFTKAFHSHASAA